MESAGERPASKRPGNREPERPEGLVVELLGPMRVSRAGSEIVLPASRKVRGLLAYLVMARRPLHRSKLCEVFWDVPNDPRGELRWSLSKLRGVLDEPRRKRVVTNGKTVSIDTATLQVDALRVGRAVEAALAGTDVSVLEDLANAIAGDFVDGLVVDRTPVFAAWVAAERERYRTWHVRLVSRCAALLPAGSEAQLAELRKRIELQPDDVSGHREMLDALAAAGRRAEGDAHLARASRHLVASGLDPSGLESAWRIAEPGIVVVSVEGEAPADANFPAATSRPSKVTFHNLPPALTSYIGRGREETDIKARLARHRLVTLVGPGGSGKTRLATEIGRGFQDRGFDGIWIVEFAVLDDPRLVGEALCRSIGIPVADSRPAAERAAAFLRDKRALVVLDNCEHLIDTIASLAQMLLVDCPWTLFLATSREPLDVAGENVYRVSGLAVPPSCGVDAAMARQHDAVALFEERAKALVQGFVLTDANASAVVDICRQLDGLPMGIELVVPQLRMLQPHGLAERLHDRVLLLVRGERGSHARHRTLGTMFDWSYNLLSSDERTLFRSLAVFNGGWTQAAAAAIAAESDRDGEIRDRLARLVDKSLVVADLRGRVPRYAYLQTTRQYALARLAENGTSPVRRRLTATMIDLFERADAAWPTTPTEEWLATAEPELDNLRAALDWAFGPDGDAVMGAELCAVSRRIWDELALLSERERWFAAAFGRHDERTQHLVLARLWLGRLSNSAHGDRSNFDLARQAADLFRAAGDRQGLSEALAKAGAALLRPDSTAEAVPYLEEALQVLRPGGATKLLAGCLRSLAIALYFDGRFDGARALLRRSETTARAVGDLRGVATVQIAAAELAFAAGDSEGAIAEIEVMLSGRHGNRRQRVLGQTNLTAYLIACDRIPEGRLSAMTALTEARGLSWRASVVRLVEHIALIAALTHETEIAARMLGHTEAFYATDTASREHTEIATFVRLSGCLAERLAPGRRTVLMDEGARWSNGQATQHAMAIAAPETSRSDERLHASSL